MLGRHRAVYTLAAIVLAAFIILKTRLVEAFMSLVFAGVVPGTGIVLSPDTMILVAATSIWVILGVVIIRAIILRNRRGRHVWHQATVKREAAVRKVGRQVVVQATAPAAVTTAAAVPLQQEPAPGQQQAAPQKARQAVPATPKAPRKPIVGPALSKFRIAFLAAARATSNDTKTVLAWLGRGAAACASGAAFAVAVAAKAVVAATKFLAAAAYSLYRRTMQLLSDLWRWAEPLLWQLDEWLELRVRRTEAWARRKIERSPRLQSWAVTMRGLRKSLRALSLRLAFKPVPGTAVSKQTAEPQPPRQPSKK
jgi:hypothetical protein